MALGPSPATWSWPSPSCAPAASSLPSRAPRIDRALWAVVMEAFVHGVSTRKVDDLLCALGIDTGVSKSQVSRICTELDDAVAEFAQRRLDQVAFPYVLLDATYVKAHEAPAASRVRRDPAPGAPTRNDPGLRPGSSPFGNCEVSC